MHSEMVLGLADYEITEIEREAGKVCISARYTGEVACPECQSRHLRSKGRYQRRVRHDSFWIKQLQHRLELPSFCRQFSR